MARLLTIQAFCLVLLGCFCGVKVVACHLSFATDFVRCAGHPVVKSVGLLWIEESASAALRKAVTRPD